MKNGESGMTLVEALVSLALVTTVFIAAGPLIVQSARLFASTGRALTDPSTTLTGGWLRRDIHTAAGIAVVPGLWTDDTMALQTQDGGFITYESTGSTLVRRRLKPDGSLIDRRVVMRGLSDWRWRSLRGLIEVEIAIPAHIDPTVAASIEDPQRLAAVDLKSSRLCFALRGGGGQSW